MAFAFDCPICGKSTGTFMRIGEHCKCKHCGNDIIVPSNVEKSHEVLSSSQLSDGQTNFGSTVNTISSNSPTSTNLVKLMRRLAWILAVLVFFPSLFMFSSIPDNAGAMKYFALFTGVGTSLMVWASFMVVAQILEDLRAIRVHLESKAKN